MLEYVKYELYLEVREMFINDYHIHSEFSGDSNQNMRDIFEKAISLGLDEIAITDHLEYDIEGMTEKWILNLDKYTKTVLEYQDEYRGKLDIKLGVEVGVQPHTREHLEEQIKKYPFDFVIASTHAINRCDLAWGELQKTRNKEELQRFYFETVLDNVKKYEQFSVYGHMDFVTRYGGPEYRGMDYHMHKDIIDEILRTLIHKGKGIEINTSGYRYKENRFYPCTDIVKRYFELGGEIITIGSDSHIKEYLTLDFDVAYEFLKSIGVSYICGFDKMKPVFKRIK